MSKRSSNLRRHTVILAIVSIGMFGFAFALVPLYEIFCELTGINGKTSSEAVVVDERVLPISDRMVTVQFAGHVSRGLPWEFRPSQSQMRVRVGEINVARYYARNRASHAVTGQAVPSVAPGFANNDFHKVECFCFTQQTLAAGEAVEMPVQFYVDPELQDDVATLTLSYTFYPVGSAPPAAAAAHDDAHAGHDAQQGTGGS